MNAKTAKLIRLYVGLRAKQGAGLLLKDVKRRYLSVPHHRRGDVKMAMYYHLHESGALDESSLKRYRSERARVEKVEAKPKSFVMGLMAEIMMALRG